MHTRAIDGFFPSPHPTIPYSCIYRYRWETTISFLFFFFFKRKILETEMPSIIRSRRERRQINTDRRTTLFLLFLFSHQLHNFQFSIIYYLLYERIRFQFNILLLYIHIFVYKCQICLDIIYLTPRIRSVWFSRSNRLILVTFG